MIYTYLKNFEKYDKEINTLYYILLFFMFVLICRGCYLLFFGSFDQFWSLIAPAITLTSAMIVTRIANRLIEKEKIFREENKIIEIVQITHHSIAISIDLKQKVGYAKTLLSNGDQPAFAFLEIAKSIESRYESLYEKDLYKYLPGKFVDIITNISGSVFGLVALANGINIATSQNRMVALRNFPNSANNNPVENFNTLEQNLQELIDLLFDLRTSLKQEDRNKTP